MKHFFARDNKGKWHYRYKIYTQEQQEFYTKMYLEMKDMKHALDFNATAKWSECLMCNLDEQLKRVGRSQDPIGDAVKLKLKELNGG